MLVSTGFRLDEIMNMSMPHVLMYAEAVGRKQRRDMVNTMDVARVAFHAEGKDYTSAREDILG